MKYDKRLLYAALTLLCAAAVPFIAIRLMHETAQGIVELCIDRPGYYSLCMNAGYSWDEFLIKSRELNISSVGIDRMNVGMLKDDPRVIVFTQNERERLVATGLVSASTLPRGETWLSQERGIITGLQSKFNPVFKNKLQVSTQGQYSMLTLPRGLTPETDLWYDKAQVVQAKEFGYKVVLKTDEYFDLNYGITQEVSQISGVYPQPDAVNQVRANIFPVFDEIKDVKLCIPELSVLRLWDVGNREYNYCRVHRIGEREINRYLRSAEPVEAVVQRYVTAVKERNVRMLYLTPLPRGMIGDNGVGVIDTQFMLFEKLSAKLQKMGYRFDTVPPWPSFFRKSVSTRVLLAFVIAILFPILAIWNFCLHQDSDNTVVAFTEICLFTFTAVILNSALLSGTEFAVKLVEFRAVKAALFLPVILIAGYVLYPKLNEILGYKLRIIDILILTGVGVVLLLFMLRSGNDSGIMLPGEKVVRSALDNFLFARPRSKEFMFGHPLLILGIFIWGRWVSTGKKVDLLWYLSRMGIIFGMVGQVSVINTFTHAHTPLWVSLLRTFNGLVIGVVLGVVLTGIWTLCEKKKWLVY
ncbi:MAG: DUF5693 family protein [Elusimicrobiota bacterium]